MVVVVRTQRGLPEWLPGWLADQVVVAGSDEAKANRAAAERAHKIARPSRVVVATPMAVEATRRVERVVVCRRRRRLSWVDLVAMGSALPFVTMMLIGCRRSASTIVPLSTGR